MKGFSNKITVVSKGKIYIVPNQIVKSGFGTGDPLSPRKGYLTAVQALHFSCSQHDKGKSEKQKEPIKINILKKERKTTITKA